MVSHDVGQFLAGDEAHDGSLLVVEGGLVVVELLVDDLDLLDAFDRRVSSEGLEVLLVLLDSDEGGPCQIRLGKFEEVHFLMGGMWTKYRGG